MNTTQRQVPLPTTWLRRLAAVAIAAAVSQGGMRIAWADQHGQQTSEAKPADAVSQALDGLKSEAVHGPKRAADRLAGMTPAKDRRKEVCDGLVTLLEHENLFVRSSALRALAVWHTPEAIPAMVRAADDKEFAVRLAALEALGKVRDGRAAEALAAQLVGRDRFFAAKALLASGSRAEPAVLACLDHQDLHVRSEACKILGNIGTGKSLRPLARRLGDPEFFVRVAANRALTRRGPEAEAAVRRMLQADDAKARAEACKVLAEVGTADSLAGVRALADDSDFFVRAAAERAVQAIESRSNEGDKPQAENEQAHPSGGAIEQ